MRMRDINSLIPGMRRKMRMKTTMAVDIVDIGKKTTMITVAGPGKGSVHKAAAGIMTGMSGARAGVHLVTAEVLPPWTGTRYVVSPAKVAMLIMKKEAPTVMTRAPGGGAGRVRRKEDVLRRLRGAAVRPPARPAEAAAAGSNVTPTASSPAGRVGRDMVAAAAGPAREVTGPETAGRVPGIAGRVAAAVRVAGNRYY